MSLLVMCIIKRSFVYVRAIILRFKIFLSLYTGSVHEAYLNILFVERLGSVDEILMNEVFRKCTLHALFADEKR